MVPVLLAADYLQVHQTPGALPAEGNCLAQVSAPQFLGSHIYDDWLFWGTFLNVGRSNSVVGSSSSWGICIKRLRLLFQPFQILPLHNSLPLQRALLFSRALLLNLLRANSGEFYLRVYIYKPNLLRKADPDTSFILITFLRGLYWVLRAGDPLYSTQNKEFKIHRKQFHREEQRPVRKWMKGEETWRTWEGVDFLLKLVRDVLFCEGKIEFCIQVDKEGRV